MELGACLDRVRERRPLIHCITNYVTANDVANLLLACGASPIMADEPEEVEEITAPDCASTWEHPAGAPSPA
jgi:hydroxyethylthiazole kinase